MGQVWLKSASISLICNKGWRVTQGRTSSGIGVDEELLFVAGGGVGGERRLAALLVVRVGFLGEELFHVV